MSGSGQQSETALAVHANVARTDTSFLRDVENARKRADPVYAANCVSPASAVLQEPVGNLA